MGETGADRMVAASIARTAELERRSRGYDTMLAALEAIIIRCEEGDKRTNWLPTIASISSVAIAAAKKKSA